MGTWPWFAGMFYFVIKIFSLTVFWRLALFLAKVKQIFVKVLSESGMNMMCFQ